MSKIVGKEITFNGETKTLSQWCKELGLNYNTVYNRVYVLGYSIEEALSKGKTTRQLNEEKEIKETKKKKVMILSDIHVPFQNEKLLDEIRKHSDVDHILIGGDLMDCESCSSFPMLNRPTLDEELVATHSFISEVLEILKPTATIECIKGNHEERIERSICKLQEKGFSKMLDPQVLRNIQDGFYYCQDGKRLKFEGIERFNYYDTWCHKFFNNIFLGHPKNFSAIPGRVSENFLKHILNSGFYNDEKGDIYVHGHTHKFSFIINDRVQGNPVFEIGCNCQAMDYANCGVLAYTSQTYCYLIAEFNEGEKIDLNNIRPYFY